MPLTNMKKVRFCLQNETPGPDDSTSQTSSQLPFISSDEVATHTDADDCWISIHGKVYDVSSYLPQHPGGAQVMLKLAGKDATVPFDEVGHSIESLIYGLGPRACVGILKSRPRAPPVKQQPLAATHNKQWEHTCAWKEESLLQPQFCFAEANSASKDLGFTISAPYCSDALLNRRLTTVATVVVMVLCISILLYMKLRYPSMMEYAVYHALPDELLIDDYEIPAWSL